MNARANINTISADVNTGNGSASLIRFDNVIVLSAFIQCALFKCVFV